MTGAYDFVPVCQSPSGHCKPSTVNLCDIKPPQFPAWFSADKKTLLMQSCPSWNHYQKHCKSVSDYPPWWVALIVLGVLTVIIAAFFILYKKKKLKWASRVSDVSFQAKQMCCKNVGKTPNGATDSKKSSISAESTNKMFENDEGVVVGTPDDTKEPYYYVLETSNSVTMRKTSPGVGTFGQRVIPPPPYSNRLPPLDTVNNNGVYGGKVAVFSPTSGRVQILNPEKEGKKNKKTKRKRDGSFESKQPSFDEKYNYGDP